MTKQTEGQTAPPGLSLGMCIWITLCTVVGAVVGGYLGLEINFIAAVVGVLLGAFIGCALGTAGPHIISLLGG